jgi:hypothetical protein
MADPDLTDVRVLIPRVRRAVDGPTAMSSGSATTTLNDDELVALIADSIAEVVLYEGDLFGATLLVNGRDESYGAPNAWKTDRELTEPEQVVIASQAALHHFFNDLSNLKISERIDQGDRQWEYAISAQALRDRIAALQAARDRALEALGGNEVFETYSSFLAVRDAATAALIEPWTVGLGGVAVQFVPPDTRF